MSGIVLEVDRYSEWYSSELEVDRYSEWYSIRVSV